MKRSFAWDRLEDHHVLLTFAVALLAAGGGAAALSLLASPADDRKTPLLTGAVLCGAGLCLAIWALASRGAERRRRAKLDRAVDSELSNKWQAGFASIVGAYKKPWYIICGETGAGKTALLRSANLQLAVGPDGRELTDSCQGLNGTFMFDWWFFVGAIILDSAGDLIQNPDKRWISFLERVRDCRPLQPINGMILAVPAPDLLGDREALRRKAALLARQVDVARQKLKTRFPLYVVITKTDLVSGFSDYFPLPSDPSFSSQILGWSNPRNPRKDDSPTQPGDVRDGLEELIESLRARRPAVLGKVALGGGGRSQRLDELYAFPDAMAEFLDATEEFVAELLGNKQATAQPFLRGVYFTSALRDVEVPARPKAAAPLHERVRMTNAGSRAFFVRDLFLQKVLPEAGLVTPLEHVATGLRRRGRILVSGAVAASVLICAATVLGYFQIAARVRPHTVFWTDLANAARAGRLSDLALFDSAGRYRGADPCPAPAGLAPGKTILDWHIGLAGLEQDRTSTWLLPLSARTESRRVETHQELFYQLALLPSLSPLPSSHVATPASLPPAEMVQSFRPILEPSSEVPASVLLEPAKQLLGVRAATTPPELSGDDLQRLSQLLQSGADRADASGTVELPRQQRAALAGWLNDQVRGNLKSRRDAIAESTQRIENTLVATRDLAGREDRLLSADSNEEQHDGVPVIDRLQVLADGVPTVLDARKPGEALPVADEIRAQYELPPGFADLRRACQASESNQGPGLLADLAKSLDEYEQFLASETRVLARSASIDLPVNERTPAPVLYKALGERLAELDRLHLGEGRPLILRRIDTYRRIFRDEKDLGSADAVGRQFAERTAQDHAHPFFSLPAVLSSFRDRFKQEADAIPRTPFGPLEGPAVIQRSARFERACKSGLEYARINAESVAWDLALRNPERIWLTPDALARPDGALQLSAREAESSSLVASVVAPPDLNPRGFGAWMTALSAAEAELAQSGLPDKEGRKARMDDIAAALERRGGEYLAAWQAAAALAQRPNLTVWHDIARVAADGPADIQDRLNRALDGPRAGIAIIAAQDRFPLLKQSARKALAPLNDTALPPTAPAILALLKLCDPASAVKSRDALLHDRAALHEQFGQAATRPTAEASAVGAYWANLLSHAIDAMVAEVRPELLDHLQRLQARADGRFPLCRKGKTVWDLPDLSPLRDDLDALRPAATGDLSDDLSRRVRDADVVNDEWGAYLDWLRRLDAYLGKREPWSITIRKTDGHGSWQTAYVRQSGKPAVEQTYVSDDQPPKFNVEGGGALLGGLSVVLLNRRSEVGGVEAAWIKGSYFDAPWSLLRLGVSMGDRPFALPIADRAAPKEARSVIVTLQLADQAVLRDMPAQIPSLPARSDKSP